MHTSYTRVVLLDSARLTSMENVLAWLNMYMHLLSLDLVIVSYITCGVAIRRRHGGYSV